MVVVSKNKVNKNKELYSRLDTKEKKNTVYGLAKVKEMKLKCWKASLNNGKGIGEKWIENK